MVTLLAQSLLEYGGMTIVIEGFATMWMALKDNVRTWNVAWFVVPVVVYLMWRRKR
jgi:hypothetical protein